ncbi:NucA/NucB deoxyribonuclease domain-containing protein [Microterricola viridarii]
MMTTKPAPHVRCDNTLPGVGPGCVIPGVMTGAAYYSMTQFLTFGARVAGAHASGLPGGLPIGVDRNPLYRMVNTPLQNLYRETVCPRSRPQLSGLSCDEYPFASTYQGASKGGGTVRTRDWCQKTFSGVPSTGSVG